MKTLTNEECSEWLAFHKLPADPYGSAESRPPFCEQFRLPHHAFGISALFRSVLYCVEPYETALLRITDWGLYEPDQMAVIADLRKAHGEHRPLIESPGQLFAATERDLLIGVLSLVTSYGWTAYLYFDHGAALLSWEGDLLDFFSSNSEHHNTVCAAMQHLGVSSRAPRNT